MTVRIRRVAIALTLAALSIAIVALVALVAETSVVEREKVRTAYEQLRQTCENKSLDEAYLMMTQDYRKRVSLSQFKTEGGPGQMYSLDAMDWIVVHRCQAWSESSGWTVGYIWSFRKEDGVWRCDGHNDTWFVD